MSQNPQFHEREITPRGVLKAGPWRLKAYEIRDADSARRSIPARGDAFAHGMSLALDWLGSSPSPGLGWLIRHVGVGARYVVVARWGNSNELFIETFAATDDGNTPPRWVPGGRRFSFCVWDMRILWHERNAFVRHMLGGPAASPDAYLADTHAPLPGP